MNANPLFVDYYVHTHSDCFKMRNPWTKFKSHVMVLCEVTEGLEAAKKLAKREILKELTEALNQPYARNGRVDIRGD